MSGNKIVTIVGEPMSLYDFAKMVSRVSQGMNNGRDTDVLLAEECAKNLCYTGKTPAHNYRPCRRKI